MVFDAVPDTTTANVVEITDVPLVPCKFTVCVPFETEPATATVNVVCAAVVGDGLAVTVIPGSEVPVTVIASVKLLRLNCTTSGCDAPAATGSGAVTGVRPNPPTTILKTAPAFGEPGDVPVTVMVYVPGVTVFATLITIDVCVPEAAMVAGVTVIPPLPWR